MRASRGAVIGGSFEPQIKADNQEVSYNLEATLGYMWKLNQLGSFGGSAGVGQRFQQESSGGNFSYYVVRVRADIDLSERWSWNVITYRFRDAFNTARACAEHDSTGGERGRGRYESVRWRDRGLLRVARRPDEGDARKLDLAAAVLDEGSRIELLLRAYVERSRAGRYFYTRERGRAKRRSCET